MEERRLGDGEDDDDDEDIGVIMWGMLPEGCIAHVISFTSPRDACRSAAVSSTFRSAADSDTVWDRFLPPSHYLNHLTSSYNSKKELFFRLCDHPILLNAGNLSFSLERSRGARCYMLSARSLSIVWGDTPQYWRWIRLSDSRFEEAAELLNVCWLEVRGKIDSKLLSHKTAYAAYFVFKVYGHGRTFSFQPQETTVMFGNHISKHAVCLAPDGAETRRNSRMFRSFLNWRGVLALPQVHEAEEEEEEEEETLLCARSPRTRDDGWWEIEMGDFYNDEGEEGEVEMSLMEVKGGYWKRGLILQGIEIRPKTRLWHE